MRTDYAIVDDWYVEGDLHEVATILDNGPDYPRWWPSTYLDVRQLAPGDERGIGREFDIHAAGWLPYTIRFRALIVDADFPNGSTMEVTGDFVGTGVWELEKQGPAVHARFTWNVKVGKPLLRRFSFLLHPVFAANHRWAMRMGERSLRLELARRHAGSAEQRARIPEPPGATWWSLGRRDRSRSTDSSPK